MPYTFSDIVDIDAVQALMDNLWQASGIPTGIIDINGTILVAAGWQKICMQFHRRHPETRARCHQSDAFLAQHLNKPAALPECGYIEYRCQNGMIDIGLPIVIEGRHLANIFLGQFFYEPPEEAFFRRQAQKYGFDVKTYLAALKQVPIFSPRKVKEILQFNKSLLALLTSMGVEKLRQMETQQDLLQSRAKFHNLFENSGDAVFILAVDGRFLEANRITCRQFGFSRRELLRKKVPELLPPDQAAIFTDMVRKIQKEGQLLFETVHLRNDKGPLPVEVSIRPFIYQKQPALLATSRDISDRKQAENRLKKALDEAKDARDRIAAIFTHIADGLIVSDTQGRVVALNHATEKLLDLQTRDALRHPLTEIIHDPIPRNYLAAICAGEQSPDIVEWQRPGGPVSESRTLQAKSSMVHDHAGEKTGVITILRDVTRERELDRLKSEFICTAAHELRSPLTSVMGYTELLLGREAMENGRRGEFLAIIYEKSQELARIIDDLLDLSRVESGQTVQMEKTLCDMTATVRLFLRDFQQSHPDRPLLLDLPDTPIALWMDEKKFNQVLDNLLNNAVKFSAPQSPIGVALQETADTVRIVVRDQGIGMTSRQMERIFDKFYRVDSSNTAQGGLGLGLAIVKSIVDAHEGDIRVSSQPGNGTEITVILPKRSGH
jgi:PAS domain S-box-containing protein